MAAIDFPNSPIVDDIFTANGRTWKYDGFLWNTVETASIVGPTGPANILTIGTVSATGPNGTPSASITGPTPNQVLNLVLQQGPTGPQGSIDSGINGLNDVTITSPIDGQLLTYKASTLEWINLPAPVSLPTQTDNAGELLITNGTEASWSNTTTANATGSVGLIVKGLASQTANLQEWQNSSAVALAYITPAGKLVAVTKSFEIDHPTKPDMRLRYGSLEGPENGVYTRGKIQGSVIELPDYWTGLVDEETITVNLTPIGKPQELFVDYIEDNKVFIGGSDINAFYTVFAERKDVDKLIVEF